MRRLLRKPAAVLCAFSGIIVADAPAARAQTHAPTVDAAAAESSGTRNGPQAESAGQRVVSGLVLDADSKQPVGDATVSAGSARVTTGPDGRFLLPAPKQDGAYKKYFIGSTFLMLGNFIPDDPNPPDFVQLNLGYRVTPADVVFLELKSSRFGWPLGIPWGRSFDAPGENYPGYVRQKVIGLAYNRFWWKGVFTGIHAMNAFQTYRGEDDQKLADGYTLFMTLGYPLR